MNGNDAPRFFGVLVTFNRFTELTTTLQRLEAQTRQLDRLLVVDNGGGAENWSALQGLRAEYVDAGDNLGPAGGYALGMNLLLETASDDDWIFLFDDDDPPFFDDAIENAAGFALEMAASDPGVGAVGISGGRFDLGTGRVSRIGDAEIRGPVPVDHITGGGLPAYRVGAVREIGVFLPELFFGFEELEYGLRLTSAGHPLYADGTQWARRKAVKRDAGLLPSEEVSAARSSATSLKVSEPSWRRYYSLRNLIFILRRHQATGTALRVAVSRGILKPLANLVTSPGLAWANLGLNWRAIRDGWRGRMGRTVNPG
jgi:rhamnopyranosyl-N-acetylglucosaminyl-diphospho-decaprenol beta-1,3/1,4-galactofuranosyltransferase